MGIDFNPGLARASTAATATSPPGNEGDGMSHTDGDAAEQPGGRIPCFSSGLLVIVRRDGGREVKRHDGAAASRHDDNTSERTAARLNGRRV